MRVSRSEELTAASNTIRNTLCYTSNVAKKAKLMRAYRLPEKTIRRIEQLAAEWECTHADVIERAIASDSLDDYVTDKELQETRVNQAVLRERPLRRGPRPKGDKNR